MVNTLRRSVGLTGLIILCLFLASMALSSHVSGQQNSTLTVSPPVFELSANPGDTLTNNVRLENPTEVPRLVTVDFRNLTPYGEEGSVNLTEESNPYALSEWLSIDTTQTTIPAKGSYTFKFTVSVPPNAEPGGHFGSIVFNTKVEAENTGQSGSKVEQEIGSLVLVKVAGDVNEDVSIASFNSLASLSQAAPIEFEARLQNNGNVQTKPSGSIVITNSFGQQVGKIEIEQKNILPGAVRRTTSTWNPGGFLFGRYSATLTIVYGNNDSTATSTTTFWVIPYRQILIGLAVLGAIIFVAVRYRKRISAAWRALRGKN